MSISAVEQALFSSFYFLLTKSEQKSLLLQFCEPHANGSFYTCRQFNNTNDKRGINGNGMTFWQANQFIENFLQCQTL